MHICIYIFFYSVFPEKDAGERSECRMASREGFESKKIIYPAYLNCVTQAGLVYRIGRQKKIPL